MPWRGVFARSKLRKAGFTTSAAAERAHSTSWVMNRGFDSKKECATICSGCTGSAGFFGVRRHVAAFKARTCPRTPNLPFPKKFRRAMDFLRKTLVHRTVERGLLEHFAMWRIGRKRDMNF